MKNMTEDPNSSKYKTVLRPQAQYADESSRFILQTRNFQRQYAHIYAARLWTLRPKLEAAAMGHWGTDVVIRRLSELQLGEDCVIIGTLYKHMTLKPNILKEISEQNGLMAPPTGSGSHSRYSDPSDELVLEDEVQRVALAGDVDVARAVSGTVVAVYGQEPESDPGKFLVKSTVYSPLPAQIPRSVVEPERFVVFMSGLDIGGLDDDLFSRQLLADLLTGQLGDEHLQGSVSQIVRVVVAGNSLSDRTRDRGAATRAKYLSKKTAAGTKDAIVVLDDFLAQLASGIPVDLMPGEFDPTTFTLPQQPLHQCMLPCAAGLATMHCVTNPYDFSIDGVRILGTSGQPVSDVVKFTDGLEDHLEVLERTLVSGHLAPTAPDTLGCYPYADSDPFIISTCPDILFTGNAPSFGSKVYRGPDGQTVLLLAVPRFSQTNTCISVSLRSLECQPIVIAAKFTAGDSKEKCEKMDVSS